MIREILSRARERDLLGSYVRDIHVRPHKASPFADQRWTKGALSKQKFASYAEKWRRSSQWTTKRVVDRRWIAEQVVLDARRSRRLRWIAERALAYRSMIDRPVRRVSNSVSNTAPILTSDRFRNPNSTTIGVKMDPTGVRSSRSRFLRFEDRGRQIALHVVNV